MSARLQDRLARLERLRAVDLSAPEMPRPMLHALFQALAIRFGGYPLPYDPLNGRGRDTIGDGFARALGFVDRAEMKEADGRDMAACKVALDAAVGRLFTDLDVDDNETHEALARMWSAILDVCAASKAAGHDDAAARSTLMGWLDAKGALGTAPTA